jgi:hypothetical protein
METMETSTEAALVVREILPQELSHLSAVPPFSEMGASFPAHIRAMGAFRGEALVAFWMLYDAIHCEPVWIAEQERANPAVIRPLWEGVRKLLLDSGAPIAYVIMGDGGLEVSIPLAVRLGFQPAKGNLFYLLVDQARSLAREPAAAAEEKE